MKYYIVYGYRRGEVMVEECSIPEDHVEEVFNDLEDEGFLAEAEFQYEE